MTWLLTKKKKKITLKGKVFNQSFKLLVCIMFNISIFDWILCLWNTYLQRCPYSTREMKADGRIPKVKNSTSRTLVFNSHSLIFSIRFQLSVGCVNQLFDDTKEYMHQEHSQPGPTGYKMGWLNQFLQLWGKSCWPHRHTRDQAVSG